MDGEAEIELCMTGKGTGLRGGWRSLKMEILIFGVVVVSGRVVFSYKEPKPDK